MGILSAMPYGMLRLSPWDVKLDAVALLATRAKDAWRATVCQGGNGKDRAEDVRQALDVLDLTVQQLGRMIRRRSVRLWGIGGTLRFSGWYDLDDAVSTPHQPYQAPTAGSRTQREAGYGMGAGSTPIDAAQLVRALSVTC